MAVRTTTQFKSLYGTSGSLFPDNTTGAISEADIRAFGEDIADSFPNESDDAYTASFPQATASGTNTYAATPAPVITAYANNQKFIIKFTNASSGVSTLNLAAIGAKKIYINPTTQATTGHIVAGQISLLVYDAALDAAAGGFLMIGAPSTTSGTVTSITPTTNRITVDNTDPAVPVIDIDAAYDAAIVAIANAKVADAINDGTTTVAPSQNAVFDALALKAPLASPTFTGTPAAPTAAPGTNTTQVASTAFVQQELAGAVNSKGDALVTLRTEAASHTLDATDLASVNAGDQLIIMMNVAGANILTIPLNATQAFPVGTVIGIRQIGAGQTTIAITATGTLNAPLNALKLSVQNALAFIEKTATNTWYANGELSL
jgi:hypothetical protein